MLHTELADIYEIRRRNLLILLADVGGRVKDLGEAMRRHTQNIQPDAASKDYPNAISQYKNGKPMGSDFARDLEASMGKPKNWMDVLQPDAAENAVEGREAAQIIMGMDPEEREAWMKLLRNAQSRKPKGPNNPFPDPDVPRPKGTQ